MAIFDAQPLIYPPQVFGNRSGTDVKNGSDFVAGFSFRKPSQYFSFALREAELDQIFHRQFQ